jgi:hypothetical protein
MKKFLCVIALASICMGPVFAAIPTKMQTDTTKVKVKKKKGKVKIKKKAKDTTGTHQ